MIQARYASNNWFPREEVDFFLENISVSVSRASYISPLKRKIFRLVDIMLLIFEHFS